MALNLHSSIRTSDKLGGSFVFTAAQTRDRIHITFECCLVSLLRSLHERYPGVRNLGIAPRGRTCATGLSSDPAWDAVENNFCPCWESNTDRPVIQPVA
jgi:hypothetical protein